MSAIQDTAYPRLKHAISLEELEAFYSPSPEELGFALVHTKELASRVYLLLSLKSFQRLGYFAPTSQIPKAIVKHIAQKLGISLNLKKLRAYDRSLSRKRHRDLIRNYLGVQPFGEEAQDLLKLVLSQAARAKNEDGDLINIAIEELLHYHYELPAFKTLRRLVIHLRYQIYEELYAEIAEALGESNRQRLDAFFEQEENYESWNRIKADVGRPTLGEFKLWMDRYEWLKGFGIGVELRTLLPQAKLDAFAAQALSLDGAKLRFLKAEKRHAIVASAMSVQLAQALDDVAEIFIKRLLKLHQNAREAQAQYRQETQAESDELIGILLDVLKLYQGEAGTIDGLMSGLQRSLGWRGQSVRSACEQHLARSSQSYYSFLLNFYGSHRKTLFQFLDVMPLRFTEASLEKALAFMQAQREQRIEWLPIVAYQPDGSIERLLPLDWVGEGWWSLLTGQKEGIWVEHVHIVILSFVCFQNWSGA